MFRKQRNQTLFVISIDIKSANIVHYFIFHSRSKTKYTNYRLHAGQLIADNRLMVCSFTIWTKLYLEHLET